MKAFLKELLTSMLATVVLCIVVSGIFSILIWGVGQFLFPHQANGSLVERNGQILGSELLAQGFSGAKYFHPRPSAAGTGASQHRVADWILISVFKTHSCRFRASPKNEG